MTEPIKLPPADVARLIAWHEAMAAEPNRNEAKRDKHRGTASELRRLLAIEQATADLRAELAKSQGREKLAWDRGHTIGVSGLREAKRQFEAAEEGLRNEMQQVTDNLLKAEAERNEARAELARLTTPQPACDHDNDALVIAFLNDGTQKRLARHLEPWEWWTPIPPVKEADHD
jgi:seryl-tRNA synthetase